LVFSCFAAASLDLLQRERIFYRFVSSVSRTNGFLFFYPRACNFRDNFDYREHCGNFSSLIIRSTVSGEKRMFPSDFACTFASLPILNSRILSASSSYHEQDRENKRFIIAT